MSDERRAAGNLSTATQTITVQDTTPPMFTFVPPTITITKCVAANIGTAVASDACGSVTVINNAPTKFPLGTTLVTWTATDGSGNIRKASQTVPAVLGDDISCCPAGTHIIVGTNGSDQLVGTSGSDCILGRGGDDVIDGRDGNDFISGGAGRDTIFAGTSDRDVAGIEAQRLGHQEGMTEVIEGQICPPPQVAQVDGAADGAVDRHLKRPSAISPRVRDS